MTLLVAFVARYSLDIVHLVCSLVSWSSVVRFQLLLQSNVMCFHLVELFSQFVVLFFISSLILKLSWSPGYRALDSGIGCRSCCNGWCSDWCNVRIILQMLYQCLLKYIHCWVSSCSVSVCIFDFLHQIEDHWRGPNLYYQFLMQSIHEGYFSNLVFDSISVLC